MMKYIQKSNIPNGTYSSKKNIGKAETQGLEVEQKFHLQIL